MPDSSGTSRKPSNATSVDGSIGVLPTGQAAQSSSSSASGTIVPRRASSVASTSGGARSGSTTPTQQMSKRRRGIGLVTPNACTECRKKRAKCDGQKPCARCRSQRDIECVYEIPVRQSKDHLRTEIENLRHKQRSSDQVLAALSRSDMWEDVLQRLRGGHSVEAISEWLNGSLRPAGGALKMFPAPGNQPPQGTPSATAAAAAANMDALTSFAPSAPPPIGSVPMGLDTSQQMSLMRNQVEQQHGSWPVSSHGGFPTRSEAHPEMMGWPADVRAGPPSRVGSWDEGMNTAGGPDAGSRYKGVDQVLAPLHPPDTKMQGDAGTWTTITSDLALVQHLLALYFCWEYPTFASLSKEHFLRDFQYGTPRYCSPLLVNALLALGCRFSTQPSTRANPNDPHSSGDHFFKECLRLFDLEENHRTLTTIQALGIMSIREGSCGRDSESWYYAGQSMRIAIEMGLHQINDKGDEDEIAVQAATFWGAFALDHAWSLATGSLPQSSCFPHLPPKPSIIDDIEASLWIPYTDDGTPLQRSCEQPSNVRSVYKCFCELSELVHRSLYILHSPGRPISSRELLNIYTQYLNWYDRIPEVLRLGHNFTPAVLFAHMYYHFAILLLFRPFIKLRVIGSKILPRDVCLQAADAIQSLLKSYSQLYTLRRTPSFVPYFVLTSVIMHLAIEASPPQHTNMRALRHSLPRGPGGHEQTLPKPEPHATEAIRQGIADLSEMAPCHHFAEQALNILRYLAKQWNIEVQMANPTKSRVEATDRLLRPSASSLNFFVPDVREEDYMCSWGQQTQSAPTPMSPMPPMPPPGFNSGPVDPMGGAHEPSGTENLTSHPGTAPESEEASDRMNIQTEPSGNPLFWPFPFQGRPIMPSPMLLEDAGFTFL